MDLFWTIPSADDLTPTDPLGLDAMRDELADKLVPCLTGRTQSHEDFYWCLAFVGWSSQCPSEKLRITRFLNYERWLKLCWFNKGRKGFAGFRQAKIQGSEKGAPIKRFARLLKNQRFQGLLGAHLSPLRSIALIHPDSLALTKDGARLVEGAGAPLRDQELPDSDWDKWQQRFAKAARGFGAVFKRDLRERLEAAMPWLAEALARSGWSQCQGWTQIADSLPPDRAPYARLAGEFIDWASRVRNYFERIATGHSPESLSYPARLRASIPKDLKHWKVFKAEFSRWNPKDVPAALARIHKKVFLDRGYSESDLWIELQDGELRWKKGRANDEPHPEGSDCRWSNAVKLLKH